MSERPVILIVSVGATDVQFVAEDGRGQTIQVELQKRGLRACHQALLSGDLPYVIVPPPGGSDRGRITWSQAGNFEATNDHSLPLSCEGSIQVCLPKLQQTLGAIERRPSRPVAVAVVSTHRNADSRWGSEEPIASGPIVAKFMAERFELEYADTVPDEVTGKCFVLNVLLGDEDLEGTDERNQHVSRRAVGRADAVLRRLAEVLPNAQAVYSSSGGPPPLKEPVEAVVRFRFSPPWLFQRSARGREEWISLDEGTPHPSDSFRDRRRACQLIRHGEFTGAAAIVSDSVRWQTQEAPWIGALDAASLFFRGEPIPLELLSCVPAIQHIKTSRPPRSLLTALQAEAAVISEKYQEALRLTVTFADNAFRDGWEVHPQVGVYDDFHRECSSETLSTMVPALFEGRRPNDRAKDGWIREFQRIGMDGLAEALEQLRVAVWGGKVTLAHMRNVAAHGHMDEHLLGEAKDLCFQNAVWIGSAEGGASFLNAPVIKAVLSALGRNDGSAAYCAVVDDVIRAMRDFDSST